MNVYCILKTNSGKTTLEHVFETFSRAYATKDRLDAKRTSEQEQQIKYKIQEMYVMKGEEPKPLSAIEEILKGDSENV